MKRILIVAIILAVYSTTCFAESFTIHSDVSFGMSMNEVLKAEQDAGFSAKIERTDEADTYNCQSSHQSSYVKVSGKIAGKNGASIDYHFDNSEKLQSAIYILAASSNSGEYTSIREALIKKYGEPNTEISEVYHAYLKPCVYSHFDWANYYYNQENYKRVGYSCSIDYYYNDSWLLTQDDGSYILVTGIEAKESITGKGGITFVLTTIGYQRFTGDEIKEVQSQFESDVEEYENQLNNDL